MEEVITIAYRETVRDAEYYFFMNAIFFFPLSYTLPLILTKLFYVRNNRDDRASALYFLDSLMESRGVYISILCSFVNSKDNSCSTFHQNS